MLVSNSLAYQMTFHSRTTKSSGSRLHKRVSQSTLLFFSKWYDHRTWFLIKLWFLCLSGYIHHPDETTCLPRKEEPILEDGSVPLCGHLYFIICFIFLLGSRSLFLFNNLQNNSDQKIYFVLDCFVSNSVVSHWKKFW